MTLRYPSMFGMFAVVDGLKLALHPPKNFNIQNAYYNGWTHDHYVSNVFLFTPDGCCAYCVLNSPGSWHDSDVSAAGHLYEILDERVPDGYFAVADSAFPVLGSDGHHIRRAPKEGETATLAAMNLTPAQAIDLVSIRQSAEWGMRALQGSFGRLKRRMPWEDCRVRGTILENCVRLLNFRSRIVGINQIRTVWMPWIESPWSVNM